ncbi:MAG: hypothetical protein PF447_01095 [Spirochaetaceae bacterium]|nr:hypothetical protein [Spirochaetaceae bacterium]
MIDVIKDEYRRLNELIDFYDKKISAYPKGSISKKKRQDRIYYYLAYRDHSRVKFEYLGKDASEKYKEVSQQVEHRHRYEKKKKEVMESLKEIEVLLRAAKRQS